MWAQRSSHRMLTRTSTSVYRGSRRHHAEPEACAFPNAGRHAQPELVRSTTLPRRRRRACTTPASVSPRPPQPVHVRRSGTSSGTVAPQNASCGLSTISAFSPDDRRFAEERMPHPIEHARHRREIDINLIREPLGAPVTVAQPPSAEPQPVVVRSPTRRVAQNVVGTGHLQERRPAVVTRDVRVIPPRKLPVRALDLLCARARRHAENVVIVPHESVG